jgi:hypothetical protein
MRRRTIVGGGVAALLVAGGVSSGLLLTGTGHASSAAPAPAAAPAPVAVAPTTSAPTPSTTTTLVIPTTDAPKLEIPRTVRIDGENVSLAHVIDLGLIGEEPEIWTAAQERTELAADYEKDGTLPCEGSDCSGLTVADYQQMWGTTDPQVMLDKAAQYWADWTVGRHKEWIASLGYLDTTEGRQDYHEREARWQQEQAKYAEQDRKPVLQQAAEDLNELQGDGSVPAYEPGDWAHRTMAGVDVKALCRSVDEKGYRLAKHQFEDEHGGNGDDVIYAYATLVSEHCH